MHIYLKWTLSLLLHKINTAFLADECRRSSFWFSLLCSASPRLAASLAPAPGCVPGLCTVVAARWWENKCCSFRDLFFFLVGTAEIENSSCVHRGGNQRGVKSESKSELPLKFGTVCHGDLSLSSLEIPTSL